MTNQTNNKAVVVILGRKFFPLLLVAFLLSFHSFAQNTKGDRPVSNQEQIKESKARLKVQKKTRRANQKASKRIPGGSSSYRANNNIYQGRDFKSTDRPAKPIGPIFSYTPNEGRSKAWKGDIRGEKLRTKKEALKNSGKKVIVHPQPTEYKKYLAKKSKKGERPWKGDAQGNPIVKRYPSKVSTQYLSPQDGGFSFRVARSKNKGSGKYQAFSESGAIKNVFPLSRFALSRPRKKKKESGGYQAFSESGDIKNTFSQQPLGYQSKEKAKLRTASGELPIQIIPRASERFQKPQGPFGNAYSIPHSFVTRGRKNVYWGKFRKGEKPFLTDLAGFSIRRRNYKSSLPPITPQDNLFNRRNTKNKPYLGDGGIPSGNKRDNAWLGDISGQKIRFKKFRDIEKVGFNSAGIAGGNYKKNIRLATGVRSISGSRGAGRPLPPNSKVGIGSNFSGWTKSRRPLKGGGSISGKTWNNKNNPITDRLSIGRDWSHSYSGFIKGVYEKPGPGTPGANFGGNVKAIKREKGGESISGRTWNNYGKSISHQRPHAYQGYDFSGVTKAEKPKVGGQSISGRLWNNLEKPIAKKRNHAYQGYDFAGNVKATKPKIGGQSISGRLWNNLEKPIAKKRNHAYQGYDFAGNVKATKPKIGGQSISGTLWNNFEKPIAGVYGRNPRTSVATSGKIKQREYIQHPKANIASIKKVRPQPGALAVVGIKSKMRQGNYQRRPKGVENALLGLGPGKNTVRASLFAGKIKMKREYVHNPKSAALALKVLSQPKSYAKMADFQGNLKMRKVSYKNTHPDARFAHLKENNTKDERTFLTNVKFAWAKMFKKNDLQPKAAKPNGHPLRYDRKEKDLWNALYDYNDLKK